MKRKKLGGTNYTNTSHPRTTHARGDTCTVIHRSSRRESPLAALCLFFLSLSSLSLCATHMQRMTRSAQHPHHVSGQAHVHVVMTPSPVHHHIMSMTFITHIMLLLLHLLTRAIMLLLLYIYIYSIFFDKILLHILNLSPLFSSLYMIN